jgi:hypothetical protein
VPANNQVPAVETPSPAETESPAEETASPSPAAPATTPAPAPLNHGPIATGTKELVTGERAIIKMKDGSTVEADAAWEDAQGIWFRRSGLVSFVEKSRVEAIMEPQNKDALTFKYVERVYESQNADRADYAFVHLAGVSCLVV